VSDQDWNADGFWGPEIVVNGERPEWLTGKAVCALKTELGWVYTSRDAPENPAEQWAWRFTLNREPCILSIRVPALANIRRTGNE